MAWETRDGRGRYYTRSRRVHGRVVREYVGGGLRGEMAALADKEERHRHQDERDARIREREKAQAVVGALAAFAAVTEAEMDRQLSCLGYHRHSGKWRRRRQR